MTRRLGAAAPPGAGRIVAGLAAMVLAVAGSTLLMLGTGWHRPPHPPADRAAPATVDHGLAAASTMGRSVPVRLDIPRIDLHTAIIRLGLRDDGTVEVPPLAANAPAGWYEPLASPGEVGPAVIIGHVDTARSGPAVFYRLGALRPDDLILVTRTDHSTATFTVTAVTEYPKDDFPTDAVYGPVDHAALRLVTCGGTFDRRTGSYRDSVVVQATLTAPVPGSDRPPSG